MEVDAHVWYWTPTGMREHIDAPTGYIEKREVIQLLENAFRAGVIRGSELRDQPCITSSCG